MKPLAMKREGDGLRIEWDDSSTTHVSWRTLRKHCPCASCLEDGKKPVDPFKVLSAREVEAGDPQPVGMKPLGHYAYQIAWNDGHDTGIYTLERLRELSC
jgi:DUF971 family protein